MPRAGMDSRSRGDEALGQRVLARACQSALDACRAAAAAGAETGPGGKEAAAASRYRETRAGLLQDALGNLPPPLPAYPGP